MQNTLEYGTLHIMLFSSYCFYLPLFFITIIYNKFFLGGGGQGLIINFATNESSLFCKGKLWTNTHARNALFSFAFCTDCCLHLRPVSNVGPQLCQREKAKKGIKFELNSTLAQQ